jgi:hypothetical protein
VQRDETESMIMWACELTQTSAKLDDASDNDENKSKQLGIGEYILHTHRHLDVNRINSGQRNCNIEMLVSYK